MSSRTITRTARLRRGKGDRGKPHLFLALRCDRPLDGGVRFCLGDADSVALGRSDALQIERTVEGGAARLRIGLPDPRMSTAHVRLQRVLGEWMAEDAGSKNGTFVDGRPVDRTQLADRALLELGHSFLIFRESLPAPADMAPVLDGRELRVPAPGFATLVPSFAEQLERLQRIASSRVTVLLQGETGTGKEVLASAVHRLSGRTGPFQALNCGALPHDLVESELFGHRRGAFSGAIQDHPGLLRSADGGTLLLDEIGDLPLPAQAALLRVLQEEEIMAVGTTRPVKVDLRVVAATHRNLGELVAQERFRADLLARLSGYVVDIPPLRDRREDLGVILAALLHKLAPERAARIAFQPDAARALLRHDWPLNVRELEKCLSSALVLAGDSPIDLDHLPSAVRAAGDHAAAVPAPGPLLAEEDRKRRDELIAHLREHAGNVTAVARAMGKARTQVQRWLRRYGLNPLSFRR